MFVYINHKLTTLFFGTQFPCDPLLVWYPNTGELASHPDRSHFAGHRRTANLQNVPHPFHLHVRVRPTKIQRRMQTAARHDRPGREQSARVPLKNSDQILCIEYPPYLTYGFLLYTFAFGVLSGATQFVHISTHIAQEPKTPQKIPPSEKKQPLYHVQSKSRQHFIRRQSHIHTNMLYNL